MASRSASAAAGGSGASNSPAACPAASTSANTPASAAKYALAAGQVRRAQRREQFVEPVGVVADAVEPEQHPLDEHRPDAARRPGPAAAACARSRSTSRSTIRSMVREHHLLLATGSGRRSSACRRRPPWPRRPSSSSSTRGRRSAARRRRGSGRGCRSGFMVGLRSGRLHYCTISVFRARGNSRTQTHPEHVRSGGQQPLGEHLLAVK